MFNPANIHGPAILLLVILALAAWTDMRMHKIPNALSLGGIALGILIHALNSGVDGLLDGIGGAAVGMAILLPFYLLRGMGAGDVKLMGAVGAFLGPRDALLATGLSLGVGGIMALGILIVHGGLLSMLKRFWLTFRNLLVTRRFDHIPPLEGETAAKKFPYAAAIGIGTLAAMWWLSSLQGLIDFIWISVQ